MRLRPTFFGALPFALVLSASTGALAAEPWVDRAITLPRHDWAFNFGVGVAHVPGTMAPGFNIEGAYAVTRALELGLRTGVRVNPEARASAADVYGRPFDTETYGTGTDPIANPEFHIRGRIIDAPVFELGLEGRVMTPFSQGLGLMFGVPMAIHFGRDARLDTGVYVPVLFYDPTRSLVSIPVHLWLQATNRFWLGPMSGVRMQASPGSGTDVPLGFGFGYSVTQAFDFKAQFLFRDVAHGTADTWGFGAGIEVRVE
jgi:hypothetical protein